MRRELIVCVLIPEYVCLRHLESVVLLAKYPRVVKEDVELPARLVHEDLLKEPRFPSSFVDF